MTISPKQTTWVVLLLFLALFLSVGCKPDTPSNQAPQTGALISPILPPATPTDEPTPPSNDWPTLTPWPTFTSEPTRSGTPVIKATPTSTPTRPPLLLTPISVGTPPADLQALYYVGDNNGTPELRVMGIDGQGRKWSESNAVSNYMPQKLWGLYPSPDGNYLALEIAYAGEMEGLAISILDRNSGKTWCPLEETLGCSGSFWGWTLDNRTLIHPFSPPPDTLRIPGGAVLVELNTGEYDELDFPVHPQWGYSLVNWAAVNPYTAKIGYSSTHSENKEEISEIWLTGIKGEEKRLLHKVKGVINVVSWSPADEQLIYLYQPRVVDSDPSELWLLNVDGSDTKLLVEKVYKDGEWRYRPTWSPDGRYVAFVQVDDPTLFLSDWREPGTNLFVVDTSTGQITRLSSFRDRNVAFPTWSPDGKFVAFVSSAIAGEPIEGAVPQYAEVWVASIDGSQLYAVSDAAQWRSALAWLPAMFSSEEK